MSSPVLILLFRLPILISRNNRNLLVYFWASVAKHTIIIYSCGYLHSCMNYVEHLSWAKILDGYFYEHILFNLSAISRKLETSFNLFPSYLLLLASEYFLLNCTNCMLGKLPEFSVWEGGGRKLKAFPSFFNCKKFK